MKRKRLEMEIAANESGAGEEDESFLIKFLILSLTRLKVCDSFVNSVILKSHKLGQW